MADRTDNFEAFYYNADHLGNIREVVRADGEMWQVTDNYPFGTPYDASFHVEHPSLQPYRYNSKELDLMHGLNAYDYGTRQLNPVLGSRDRIVPLCEKYHNISPYAYCHDNPVNAVDPDGREVREGTGPYSKENAQLKLLAINLARQDDPNSIMIVAHGSSDYSFINIQTYNPKTGKWNDNLIHDGKEMNRFLSANSKVWQKYQEGKIEAKDLHIVLYSCYSTDVAKRISADEHFKDIPVIGADRSVITNGKDVNVGTPVYDNNKRIVDAKYNGLWITYKNGHQPFINGNYRGNQNLKPGTKNFSYETTWP
jgi:RHS repeat-associated protein